MGGGCCEFIQPNSPVRIVVAVAHVRPRNYANLSTIKVSNSSFFAYGLWFNVWFVNRQEIKRLELVYSESFLFELLETREEQQKSNFLFSSFFSFSSSLF